MTTTTPDLPVWTSFHELPRAHGEPLGTGRLRATPADFQVEEQLGFAPDDEGDHLLLWIRKTGANTEWAARRLAALVGVPASEVGFAGLKDRHAITWQWFSLPRPRDTEPDWPALAADGIEVLEVRRHRRKLRRGTLAGNRFRLLVRDWSPSDAALDARLAAIRARGLPNYFGDQRFGHTDGNLLGANELFAGRARRVDRHRRGLWLSAARSQLFNQVLAERVRRGDWDAPLVGDRLQLDGCHSHFAADEVDDTIRARCAGMDLHPTGPLAGAGEPLVRAEVGALEARVLEDFPGWLAGLAAHGLRQERRALRLPVRELDAVRREDGVELRFALPAGSYATVVLRELIDWEESVEHGTSTRPAGLAER